jgi:hypothetical protein
MQSIISILQNIYREMEDIESLDSSLFSMKENFLKYWEEVPIVIIITNCIHPSFKKKIL